MPPRRWGLLTRAAPLVLVALEPTTTADVAWVLGPAAESCDSVCGKCQSHCRKGEDTWPRGYSWRCDPGIGHSCETKLSDDSRHDLSKRPSCGWKSDSKAMQDCSSLQPSNSEPRFCPCSSAPTRDSDEQQADTAQVREHSTPHAQPQSQEASSRTKPPAIPAGWKAIWNGEHQTYYYWNTATDKTTWVVPGVEDNTSPEELGTAARSRQNDEDKTNVMEERQEQQRRQGEAERIEMKKGQEEEQRKAIRERKEVAKMKKTAVDKQRTADEQTKEQTDHEAKMASLWARPCESKEACLEIVDQYLNVQPRQDNLLMRTYGPKSLGGGPCGALCDLPEPCPSMDRMKGCRHDIYDNAVAAIYFTKRGHLAKARSVLDALVSLLYPSSLDGIPAQVLHRDLPSNRTLVLLAAAYTDKAKAHPGVYHGEAVYDGAVDVGNNAWVALAFAHYAASVQSACHADVARDILAALTRGGCDDKLKGFMGRLSPQPQQYRSTEHNIDVSALARVLGEKEIMHSAQTFVQSMFSRNADFSDAYSMGTGGSKACDHSQPKGTPIPADCIYWNILADVDPDAERMEAALKFALQLAHGHGRNASDSSAAQGLWTQDVDPLHHFGPLTGTRFSTAGHGVQWEVTAGAVMAMLQYELRYGRRSELDLSSHIHEARISLRRLLGMYGGVPGSVLGGNRQAWIKWTQLNQTSEYPGGSDTGISWSYLRYLHVASTAWTGLLLLFQFDETVPLENDANPMMPTKASMPVRKDASCLPPAPIIISTSSTRGPPNTSSATNEDYFSWRCWKRRSDARGHGSEMDAPHFTATPAAEDVSLYDVKAYIAWKQRHQRESAVKGHFNDREYREMKKWQRSSAGAKDLNDCRLKQEETARKVGSDAEDKFLLGSVVQLPLEKNFAVIISLAAVTGGFLASLALAVQRWRRHALLAKPLMRTIVCPGDNDFDEGAE